MSSGSQLPTPYAADLLGSGPQRVVRRAEAFLRDHLSERFTIRDLSREVGVSTRALHLTFVKHAGAPPMRYLKMVRLSGAREDLRHAPPGTLVTDVAIRWGFFHFGRFAGDYLRRFGEKPSATLVFSQRASSEPGVFAEATAIGRANHCQSPPPQRYCQTTPPRSKLLPVRAETPVTA